MAAIAHRHSRPNREFVVFCPTHPDVVLTRQRRRLFGRRRIEIIHDECPLCQESLPSMVLGSSGNVTSHSFRHSTADVRSFRPSAPYIDEIESPTRHSNRDSTITAQASNLPSQHELARNISEMVYSLLDTDSPDRGPDFVVDQLEMLCAWSLGESAVRKLIIEAGGIYIVTNILKGSIKAHGPRLRSNETHFLQPISNNNQQQHPMQQQAEITTLATQSIADDTSTIVTNDADVGDAIAQFNAMEQEHDMQSQFSLATNWRSRGEIISDDASTRAVSVAGSWTQRDGNSTMSCPGPSKHNMLSYPGLYYYPPMSSPRNNDQSNITMDGSVSYSHTTMQDFNFKSPPAPTLNEIDQAFGHFLEPPESATKNNTDHANNASSTGPSRTHWTTSIVASEYDDMSETTIRARSTVYGSVSRKVPSISGSSVSAYISVRVPGAANTTSARTDTTGTDRALLESRWAVAALANLSVESVAVDLMRSAGGIETLMSAIWLFEDDEMIQDCGCECLFHLISAGVDRRPIKSLIVSYGAIASFLRAMKLFPATATLQHKCCLLIGEMVVGDPVVLQSIVTLSGVELLILAMRLHRLDEKVQEAACLALDRAMAGGGRLYVEVVSCRGIEMILTAMWQFETNLLVQLHGCNALGYICLTDDGNKPILTEAGAVETIITAMRNHRGSVDVLKAGCVALRNLTERYGPAAQQALNENVMEFVRQVSASDPSIAKELRICLMRKY